MDSTDDYSVALLPGTSPLNTALDEITLPGSSKDTEMEESEEEITSYQPQMKQPDRSAKQRQTTGKEKQNQTIFTLWKQKSRELRSPLKNYKNTWTIKLVRGRYVTLHGQISRRTNSSKKNIQAVKLKVEKGFLSVLTRFNHRHLEKQKTRLRKEKGKTVQKGTPKRGSNTSKRQNQPLSADISVKSLAPFLGMDSE